MSHRQGPEDMQNYKILSDWEQVRETRIPEEGRRKSVEGGGTKYS